MTTDQAIRCPYCVVGDSFRLMSADSRGRFVCATCSHIAIPSDSGFQCYCQNCCRLKGLQE
jgi:hypothetical protein